MAVKPETIAAHNERHIATLRRKLERAGKDILAARDRLHYARDRFNDARAALLARGITVHYTVDDVLAEAINKEAA